MLSERMHKALNDQLQAEFYSAYLYLSMAAYCEDKGMEGMANWMTIQFQEEQTHALKIYRYIAERGGRVELQAIEKPRHDWPSLLSVFEEALEHEKKVSGLINDLAQLTIEEKDHATHNMLQWFIAEQVEEEATLDTLVGELKLVGDGGSGLFMIDRELRGRTFVDETKDA